MKQCFLKKAGVISVFLIAAMSLAMATPLICNGDEYIGLDDEIYIVDKLAP